MCPIALWAMTEEHRLLERKRRGWVSIFWHSIYLFESCLLLFLVVHDTLPISTDVFSLADPFSVPSLTSMQHPFAPGTHYQYKPGNDKNLKWYEDYNKEWGILGGADCCSPSSVSFHYIKKAPIVRHIYKILYDAEACPRNTL